MKRKLRTKPRTVSRTRTARRPLKVVPEGAVYVYSVKLPNGQTISAIDKKLGKYAAVSYNDRMGFGDIFQTKAEAEAYLKLTDRGSNFKTAVLTVEKVELLNADGSKTEVPRRSFFGLLKKLLGRK